MCCVYSEQLSQWLKILSSKPYSDYSMTGRDNSVKKKVVNNERLLICAFAEVYLIRFFVFAFLYYVIDCFVVLGNMTIFYIVIP